MAQGTDWLFWLFLIVMVVVFFYVPQWLARRRQRQREKDLQIGDRVLTVGGFLGTLTHYDAEANIARIRLADNVEVEILPGAIRGKQALTGGEGERGA